MHPYKRRHTETGKEKVLRNQMILKMTNDSQKGSTLKDLQQKIWERFDELGPIWLEDNDKGTTDQWIPRNKARFFVLSELEKALLEFAGAVRIERKEELLVRENSWMKVGFYSGFNAALTEQKEKIKRFFELAPRILQKALLILRV